ncbi:uncharacterized protein BX664DRAFT_343323 [Halteromyces radiatus]|uniref:uncharacterized protein n=1 Tax=Halteromyces radiatus TaxID=101107 RepID=UPI00222127E5|nr:uncharacterized protein BX664DRAFT_343323 [Halteromyces radiatus]KAI8077718.1 hypothetical protein BX664DRAFT_343323 [Halteromyces radiatus]
MTIILSDLPYELLFKVAQHLTFSDLWYFGTCSKSLRRLAWELILTKYQINLIRPKVINPFAQLVHAAVAYLERYGHLTTTIQSVANHLTVAINDRTPHQDDNDDIHGMAATLDFLLDHCLAILIDSIFLDLPSTCSDHQWNQLSPPFYDQQYYTNPSTSSSSSLASSNTSSTTTTMNNNVTPMNSSYDTSTTCAALRMADFLSILDSILNVLFVAPPHRRLLMSHLHRVLVQLTKQYRKKDQSETAKMGLRVCILFICRLVQHGLLSVSDVNAFARQLPEFFITQPSDVQFGRLGDLYDQNDDDDDDEGTIYTIGGNIVMRMEHPRWQLWFQETELRMMILLDLVRVVVGQLHDQRQDRHLDRLDLHHLTSMLQDTFAAFSAFKPS